MKKKATAKQVVAQKPPMIVGGTIREAILVDCQMYGCVIYSKQGEFAVQKIRGDKKWQRKTKTR